MWALKNDICIAVIRKAGCSSIRFALGDFELITNEEALKYPVRVAFIRHPTNENNGRLVANYWFWKYLENMNIGYDGNSPKVDTWEDWIDFYLTNPDPHWDSQVKHLTTDSGEFVPTVCHRFEDIDEYWADYFKLIHPNTESYELPHLNKTVCEPIVRAYRDEEIMYANADDLRVWESIS